MNVLESYEADIAGYELSYQKAAKALLAIREGELWSEDYHSWEDYCATRWKFTKGRVSQLLSAGRLLLTLENAGSEAEPPPNERVAREVLKVKVWEKDDKGKWHVDEQKTEKKRVDTWEAISRRMNGEAITAEDARQLRDQFTGRGMSSGPSQEKQDEAARRRIWNAIKVLAEPPLTPKQLIGGKTFGEFPNGHKAIRYLNKLLDLLS